MSVARLTTVAFAKKIRDLVVASLVSCVRAKRWCAKNTMQVAKSIPQLAARNRVRIYYQSSFLTRLIYINNFIFLKSTRDILN